MTDTQPDEARISSDVTADSGGSRIEARGLGRRFGSHEAVRDLDLEITPGESFGLLGANGAGKTTFIRLVTGFLIPTAGSVSVDGLSPSDDPREVQQRLGFVAESSRLFPGMRVEAYLRFAGGIRGLAGSALETAIEATLQRFQLADVRRRMVGNLSKGYQQRVSLAQAFLHGPSLLIADEPTSGLDPLQQADVRESLAELRGRGTTLLLCTHDLEEARALTTRVAILYQGRLVTSGPSEAVLSSGDVLDLFRGRAGATA